MSIKAVMCDLDGTLLTSEGTVSSNTLDAIKKLRKNGILFGLCTGRSVDTVKVLMPLWGIQGYIDAIVGSGGGEIYDYTTDTYEKSYTISGDLIREIMDHFMDMNVNFAILYGGKMLVPKDDRLIQNLSVYDKTPYEVVDYDQLLQEDHSKLIIICDPETMPAVIERSKSFHDDRYRAASLQTTQMLYEYMDPRVTKASGLEKFLANHNLTKDQLCTFGDADNDYEMTAYAGIGVVMANGTKKTKSVADVITDDNDHDGISNYINKHLL